MTLPHALILALSVSVSAAIPLPLAQQSSPPFSWAWQLNDVDHCDGMTDEFNGRIATNFTAGTNLTLATCLGFMQTHYALHCSLSASGDLIAQVSAYDADPTQNPRILGQGPAVRSECSAVPDFTKYGRPFVGMCCFPAPRPPAFPLLQPYWRYQTDGADTREIFSCTRKASAICTYPGPMSNWTCADFPSSVKPTCEDRPYRSDTRVHRKCGQCAYEEPQEPEDSAMKFVTRFCAKDSDAYLLVSYTDGNCQKVDRSSSPKVVNLTVPHRCSIEGHCSAAMPARTCSCMCGFQCVSRGIKCSMSGGTCSGDCCGAGGGPEQLRGTETWDQIL